MIVVVVDSDALIGSLNPGDLHFDTATKILQKLAKNGAKLIYPVTVIVESVTFLQGRLNEPVLANKVLELVNKDELTIAAVDNDILKSASAMMDFGRSKHNTLFDCVVMAVADENKANAIFSFDKLYEKRGYKLALDL